MFDRLIEGFWDVLGGVNILVALLASGIGIEGPIGWPIYIGLVVLVVLAIWFLVSERFIIIVMVAGFLGMMVWMIWEYVSGWIG